MPVQLSRTQTSVIASGAGVKADSLRLRVDARARTVYRHLPLTD